MSEAALVRAVAGIFLGGVICIVGLAVIRYPYATFMLLQGWRHEDPPELSDRGRRDVQGAGVVFVITGLVIAHRSIR